jgi:hypothetical protein
VAVAKTIMSKTPSLSAHRRPLPAAVPEPSHAAPALRNSASLTGAASAVPQRPIGAVQERLLRQLSGQKKFENASRTLRAEVTLLARASDANRVAREAMRDTDALLNQFQLQYASGDAGQNHPVDPQRAHDARAVLGSVQFELDCFDTVATSLDQLQRIEQSKLAVTRQIVDFARLQDPALGPQLEQRERQVATAQLARGRDRALVEQTVEHRTVQLAARLQLCGIFTAH